MDGGTRYADGPGGCTVDKAEAFEQWWEEKKASMTPDEFALWRSENSCRIVTPNQLLDLILADLRARSSLPKQ